MQVILIGNTLFAQLQKQVYMLSLNDVWALENPILPGHSSDIHSS